MNSKILIVTRASEKIGFGHITRCLHLALSISKTATVEFCSIENDYVPKLAEAKGFKSRTLIASEVGSFDFESSMLNTYGLVIFDLLEKDLDKFDFEAQLVFTAFIYTFNPLKMYGKPNLVFFPGAFSVDERLLPESLVQFDFYSGLKFLILSPSFKGAGKKNSFTGVKNIVISMGGSDPLNHTYLLLDKLKQIKLDLSIDVVLGPGYTKESSISEILTDYPHTTNVVKGVDSLIPYLCKTDLAFIPGGTTRFEATCLGVPFVQLAFNQAQMKNNAAFVKQYDVGFDLGLGEELTSSRLIELFNDMNQHADRVNEAAIKGTELVDGLGIDRVSGLILGLLDNG